MHAVCYEDEPFWSKLISVEDVDWAVRSFNGEKQSASVSFKTDYVYTVSHTCTCSINIILFDRNCYKMKWSLCLPTPASTLPFTSSQSSTGACLLKTVSITLRSPEFLYYHECDGMFRIQNAASDDPVFALVLLHAMTVPLNGLYRWRYLCAVDKVMMRSTFLHVGAINAVVFGLDRNTREQLTVESIRVGWRCLYQCINLNRSHCSSCSYNTFILI